MVLLTTSDPPSCTDELGPFREEAFRAAFPIIQDAQHTTTSTTKSKYRLHWRILQLCDNFQDDVNNYFNTTFAQADATAMIMESGGYRLIFSTVNGVEAQTEADIKRLMFKFVETMHNTAARGQNGAPPPWDLHASLVLPGLGTTACLELQTLEC